MRHRFGSIVVVGICFLFAMGHIVAPPTALAAKPGGLLRAMGEEVAAVSERVMPAVVSIRATSIHKTASIVLPEGGQALPRDLLEELLRPQPDENGTKPGEGNQQAPPDRLRELFGPQYFRFHREFRQEEEIPVMGRGSGFIVEPDGYILTNTHVVSVLRHNEGSGQWERQDADKIEVTLTDGRTLPAEMVGTDEESDVALIKIDATGLPTVELGDSDTLKVGHFVVVVGDPLGLDQTVTFGIVSSLGRSNLAITGYDNFIQTDSAINKGNSGGPMVDVDGKVVGVSTAILSTSGGSQGLGLAIPINDVRWAAEALRATGKVVRGYLGLYGKDLLGSRTPEMAEHLGSGDETGFVIEGVVDGTPADEAGLQVGDAVVRLDGEKIADYQRFRHRVARIAPGETIRLRVIRDGERIAANVTLAERPPAAVLRAQGAPGAPRIRIDQTEKECAELGATVKALDPGQAKKLGFAGLSGVVVVKVKRTSAAFQAGLRAKMLITKINRFEVATIGDVEAALLAGEGRSSVMVNAQDATRTRLLFIPKE